MVVVEKRASDRNPARPASSPGERVDLDQVPIDVDARALRRLGVGADGVGVSGRSGCTRRITPNDHRHEGGDHHEPGDLPEEIPGADVLDERERDVAQVDAVGDELRDAERRAERAERDDQRRDPRLGDQDAVEHAPRHAGDQARDEPDQDHAQVVAADVAASPCRR